MEIKGIRVGIRRRGGTAGNRIEIEKNGMKVYKILFSFFTEIEKKTKLELSKNVNISFIKLKT